MTADAAHVAAVATALFARGQVACEFHGGTLYDECASCCGLMDELHRDATVAVETLTPLIRAQVAAEIRARAGHDWKCCALGCQGHGVMLQDGTGAMESCPDHCNCANDAAARIAEATQ